MIGAGWVGAACARALVLRGHPVIATVRRSEQCRALRLAGIKPHMLEIGDEFSIDKDRDDLCRIGSEIAHWVVTLPPQREYGQKGNEKRHIMIRDAAQICGVQRLVLYSSTSVYPMDGEVTENDVQMDAVSVHTGLNLFRLEQIHTQAGYACIVLRFGALIGRDRHPLRQAALKGWKTPNRRMNVTTQDDAIAATLLALDSEEMSGAYNVVAPDHPRICELGKAASNVGWLEEWQTCRDEPAEGRSVISGRLQKMGFSFETERLNDWVRYNGGPQTKLSIPSVSGDIRCHIHHRILAGESQFIPDEVLVFAHGYKGFSAWGAWSDVMDALTTSERSCCRFDFTHNGTLELFPNEILDLDRWSLNTYRKELEELVAVCAYWSAKGTRVVLMGHSRGGGIAILAARACAQKGIPISRLVLWASVSDFGKRFPSEKDLVEWEATDRLDVLNTRTKQVLHHSYLFYSDFAKSPEQFHILDAARSLKDLPVLICHASDDMAVPQSESEELMRAFKQAQLLQTQHGGHTFGSVHPWPSGSASDELELALKGTRKFLNET